MSSSDGTTMRFAFRRARASRGGGIELRSAAGCEAGARSPAPLPGRVPRVTRLLALAHRFAALLAEGDVGSMAELARVGRVTRARLTQIMDLTLLAPDIQEGILGFEPGAAGPDPVAMRDTLAVVRSPYWPEQRRRWAAVRARRG